ncbi:Histidine kinase-, DNA gyrase B-, and HSP90-like ATPase [Acetitomaculum ruminis DSM 5522]|uniref:histidine kinase n=1 Tax=Acetitomaculum ruminis DSM 5522 TaxID=1120918 RepID=A0A1I0YAJ8_9FIRM|nr:HAMP domain-containing sensor histidine kinase [Acetitomaculum ruminis]SFB10314.1 Histidine kinase-, DNA gyrase B-, and HSP90-like ATPase [Acetitomaculum ruminis DSM 5522]
MVKRLQKQFICVASASILIVMLVVVGMIYFLSLYAMNEEIHSLLDIIAENDGAMPKYGQKDNNNEISSKTFEFVITEESMYEVRYFSVIFDENENILSANYNNIAAIKDSTCEEYARKAFKSDTDFKRIDKYYYLKKRLDNGNYMVVFVDSTLRLENLERLMYTSLWITLACFILFFMLVSALSKRALKTTIQSIEKQKEFITNASHELKTPLAVISANTELMVMLNGANEWTDSTLNQVKRLDELIKNLVAMSRMEERKEQFKIEEVNATCLVEEIVDSYEHLIVQKEYKIEKDIAQNVVIKSDSELIKQLLTIFLDNAIKYTDEKGTIKVALKEKTRSVKMTVSNTYAQGANVDYQRFTDRFYREDSSHNIEKGGYGIGLSMAKELVESNRGKFKINWKNGEIFFTVILNK